ncbi:MAG TPA: hypothetical protein VGM90_09350 [Kofleriaceae bacterium]
MSEDVEPAAPPAVLARIAHAKAGPGRVVPVTHAETGETIGRAEALHAEHLTGETGDAMIERFVRWRNFYRNGWLDQRLVTPETTRAWAARYLATPTTLLYLLYAGDVLIGRTGFLQLTATSFMTDGLVRGERGGGPRFLHRVSAALAVADLELTGISAMRAKILSDNDLALDQATRYGYRVTHTRALYRHRDDRGVWLDEDPQGGELDPRQLLFLRAERDALLAAAGTPPAPAPTPATETR